MFGGTHHSVELKACGEEVGKDDEEIDRSS